MFEKYSEKIIRGRYVKGYKCIQGYDFLELINLINSSNYKILNIYLRENSDVGSKVYMGNYSYEQFVSIYPRIDKDEIEGISIDLEFECNVYLINRNYLSLTSTDPTVELDDILASAAKKKM